MVAPDARLWLPVFALFTLHNLEEILLDLPHWGRSFGMPVATTALDMWGYAGLIAVMSLVLFGAAFAVRRNERLTRLGLRAFLGVMMANFVMHAALSVITQSLQPGVITAVLFLPVYGWLLRRVRRAGRVA